MKCREKKKISVWNKTQQFQFISIQTGFGEIRNYQTQNSKCPSMYFHRPSALHQHKQSVFHSADTRQSPNKRNQNDRKCYRGPKRCLGVYCKPPLSICILQKRYTGRSSDSK